VKVGHCQVNYKQPPRSKQFDGGFAFAQNAYRCTTNRKILSIAVSV
jgi:hypothetical protein